MLYYDLIIVGAGPSGLALAHVSSNIYRKILIIDKEHSIGGIHRVLRDYYGIYTEYGPRTYMSIYYNFINIIKELRLDYNTLFIKYKYNFISNLLFRNKLTLYENYVLICAYMKYLFNDNYGKNTSLYEYTQYYKFSTKSIDIIDELGSSEVLKPENQRKKILDVEDIERIVSQITKIPEKNISVNDRMYLKDLDKNLKRVIFGQDLAIDSLVSSIKLSRSGLRDSNRTIGNYMFSGQTGVGKTELAKQLAKVLGIELIRFDMSEYMERHSVSKLIGAPPGYVGFDQGGLLSEKVDKNPYAVLLIDEIEKAHPDVYNVLLQIMDYGKLTDQNGKKIDFRNIILIMTTNAGAEDLQKSQIGFNKSINKDGDLESINKIFSPEFRNRLDSIVQFNILNKDTVKKIVEKFVIELETQLGERDVIINLTDKASNLISKLGFDEKMGARPLNRVIDEKIKKPLADELIHGK
jgi:ATP-dependent Clp protease ATP-binding subunit ClpA